MKALLALIALAGIASAAPQWEHARLPRTFAPARYRVRLAIDDTTKLVGHVEIDGAIVEATRVVWLDFVGKVTHAEVMGGKPLVATAVGDRVALEGELSPGALTLVVDFEAKLDDEGKIPVPADGVKRDTLREQMMAQATKALGAFRQTVDGAAYTFTSTEPMDARRMFPCLDEPDRKVPWELTLDVDATLTAASNAPILKETPLDGGRKRVTFERTQPLPSYLVAFAVGPFDAIDAGKTKSGAPVRLLVTKGHHAAYAAATAARLVDQLADWTGIPYAYGKLDLVAVPRTGAHWAAMENPGLVTFADWIVRGDDSRDAKRTWVSIASHEFAHQWFGDLVTMAWWNDIWLNESFAVYLAREMVARFEPAWIEPAREAFVDHVPVARPPIEDSYLESHLLAYFSGARGARSLAMFAQLLGDKFRPAIHDYLAAHAHGTATTTDLVAALGQGEPFARAALASIDQPLETQLDIHLACTGAPAAVVTSKVAALAPVCVAYDRDGARATACTILDGQTATLPLPAKSCPSWLVPNAGGAMLYTAKRTPAELEATVDHGWRRLDDAERFAVLDELGPDLATAFRLADAPGARLWSAETIARALRVVPHDLRDKLDAWLRRTYLPRAKKVKLDEATHEDAAIVALATRLRDPDLERAALPLAKHLADLDVHLVAPVLRAAVHADPTVEQVMIAALDHSYFERRRALLEVLGELPDVQAHAADMASLTRWDRLVMVVASCDPARRAEAQRAALKMSDNANALLREMNACLDARDAEIALWRKRLLVDDRP